MVENSAEQIASFDFTLAVAPGSAGFRLQERLWQRFRVYTANSQGNPVGNLDAFTLLSFDQASTVLTSGEVSVIAGVGVSPFDTFNTLCRDIPMFCVTLEEDPDYSVVFLNGADTACVPISCRGVEVLDVNILSNGPEVREREPTFLLTEFRAARNRPDGASVTGLTSGTCCIFDDQADCLGNAFPGTRTTDSSSSDLPVRAGQTLSLTSPFFVMNLQNLACPSGPLYLCVEFDKQEITTPPFTLSFPNGVNTRYGSVEARCRGVEIFTSRLSSIPDGVIVQEGDTSRNLC
ncbi:fibrosurfin [Apostichopus japonicus]|uniref:Fibrosurfin n=1 Tax=Stichopus japonicus TaxID=307972 RepID=A0A2G8KGY4_STIJA|nr:fibrosurfin [Apostichopus japonicus]